ncbi:hypothetical protein BZY71_24615 [Leclercia adecarboxylata]|nr:hypothetical protein BZY71_24615 [Leclercia adecarboxylata]
MRSEQKEMAAMICESMKVVMVISVEILLTTYQLLLKIQMGLMYGLNLHILVVSRCKGILACWQRQRGFLFQRSILRTITLSGYIAARHKAAGSTWSYPNGTITRRTPPPCGSSETQTRNL